MDPSPAAVDAYLASLFVTDPPVVETADLPDIAVSPVQGKLLCLLARAIGARRVLEVGTLAAYSTTWLARAVAPDGAVVSLEVSAHHADVARANLSRAGLGSVATVVVGPAVETLPGLEPAFDLVFVDADKENNAFYADQAARLLRPGGVFVLDNVVRDGAIITGDDDPRVRGTVAALESVARDARWDATAIQMVGAKGWDGFLLAVRT